MRIQLALGSRALYTVDLFGSLYSLVFTDDDASTTDSLSFTHPVFALPCPPGRVRSSLGFYSSFTPHRYQ
ncbi:hypothetical protein NKDENANG_01584 [Candidatus Entotheonellaceae bacterium PAL068K]